MSMQYHILVRETSLIIVDYALNYDQLISYVLMKQITFLQKELCGLASSFSVRVQFVAE